MPSPDSPSSFLTPRKIFIQVIGWIIGLGLLAWIIKGAVQQGDWQRIRHADPWMVAALLGCTMVSAILNGTSFWVTIQPLRRVRWRDMQCLNLVANMLNYAPVRLGAVARIVYHLRVDRLNLLQIGAWFAMIAYILFLGVGACLLATLVHNHIDWMWFGLVLGQMIVGGVAARFMADVPLVMKYGRGIDQMVVHRNGFWGAMVLRLLDLAAYAGRMAAALAILQVHLPASDVVKLAMVAMAVSLSPVARLGLREFFVAAFAAKMQAAADRGIWDQLALIESAGEALIFLPGGAAMLWWFRKRLKDPVATDAAAGQ